MQTTDGPGGDGGRGGVPARDPWADSGVAQQDFPAGLYVVATPLGNAADVSLRALWVLSGADAIAAEDTRTTAPLLARYGIESQGRLLALHKHNEARAGEALLQRLARGERIALVSDAGTPAISDPGALLVREVLAAGIKVIAVPGPSSMAAALSVAGITGSPIAFAGFAPAKAQARRRHWEAIGASAGATVVFEAPHRIEATARELAEVLDPRRRVVVARELTKKFESVRATTAAELAACIAAEPQRGEYALVIDAAPAAPEADVTEAVDATTLRWLQELARELPASRAAAVAARASGLPREVLYRRLTGE
jgi:16S rRNA (cytidine1402-2'-O)-methyltransferase